ncbi:hypothetical protein PHMEG_0008883 [Phytophthora megakarya]|uniref:DUF6570 domain-containing protein n=1 Tax=Phytophthora megakarya TaxID=4795 RepID=A0A225WK36_9STRA|nr:hypothetical protein PHMEG_0008883 [Phytophthora megakarya]
MMTQLITVVACTRVLRGGVHRPIRSHCMAFDATPGPPATLLPRSLDKLGEYRVVVAGQLTADQLDKIRKLHVIRGSKVEGLLRFYVDQNHLYQNVKVSVGSASTTSEPNIDDTLFDFVEDEASNLVQRVDEDQARVGAASDLDVASTPEDENEVIERSIVFVNTVSKGNDNLPSVSELPPRRCIPWATIFGTKFVYFFS